MDETQKRTDLTTSAGHLPTPTPTEPSPATNKPLAPLPRGGSLLDHAFNSLPPETQQELAKTAVEKKIDLEFSKAKSAQAYENFQDETKQSAEHLRNLGKTGMDIQATYEGQTPSGRWYFEATKSNYTVIMVVAAIIGIVLLVVALRG